MLCAARPNLLPVHHICTTLFARSGTQICRIRPTGGFGDPKSLQAQLSACDFRQVFLFLRLRPVTQYGAHRIHLRMTSRSITAGMMDFL